jgi:phage gp16-like protein
VTAAALPARRPAPRPAATPAAPRANGLAQIHIAKKQLGLDDDTYRAMLWAVARVRSSKDLDHAGRMRVLDHLKRCGFKPKAPAKPHAGRPRNMDSASRGPLLGKIEAHLLSMGRPWAYAHAMAQRMHGIADVSFCHEEQLYKIVQALEVDKRRRLARAVGGQA